MLKLGLIATILFLTAACGTRTSSRENGNGSVQDASDSHEKPSAAVIPLKTSTSIKQPQFNELRLVNVHPQVIIRNYSYTSSRNAFLKLGSLKNGPFIGCQESNLAFDFRLYKADRSGEAIESLGYQGLGFTPVPVDAGQLYIVRYMLTVEKECLGLISKFSFIEGSSL